MRIHKVFYAAALLAVIFAAAGGCSRSPREETPTDVLRKFVGASQKKDVEVIKQTLSSGTLKMIEESARRQNITLEESLRADDGRTLKEMPETRNEKIGGEQATVEVKNAVTSDWDTIPFVREEGKWKISFDKFMNDLERKLREEMNLPGASGGGGGGTTSGGPATANTARTPAASAATPPSAATNAQNKKR